jgi:hypothetical protein
VIDGVPGPQLGGRVQDLVFSPDSKRVAFTVAVGWLALRSRVFVDGTPTYLDKIREGTLTFTPDSTGVAYVAHRKTGDCIVVAGVDQALPEHSHYMNPNNLFKGTLFCAIPRFAYSPDGTRMALLRWYGGEEVPAGSWVEVDGSCWPGEVGGFPIAPQSLEFSPNSKHFAYRVDGSQVLFMPGPKQRVVVDGLRQPPYDEVMGIPVFRADGAAVYFARRGRTWYRVMRRF